MVSYVIDPLKQMGKTTGTNQLAYLTTTKNTDQKKHGFSLVGTVIDGRYIYMMMGQSSKYWFEYV